MSSAPRKSCPPGTAIPRKRAPKKPKGSGYIVVTTTYPTTYGCHRGMSWSRADLIMRSDRSRSGKTYPSRGDAIRAARKKRNRNDWFTDACEPDSDDSDDEEDYGDGGDYTFTNSDEPPYDSADLENYDNDEEVVIEVMTLDEFETLETNDREYLQKERMRSRYEGTLEQKILGMQIRDAGRVYYASPPQPELDIKAELEAFDYEVGADGKEEREGDYDLKPVVIPANASTIKTLMYKGGKQGLGKFAREFARIELDEDDEVIVTDQELETVGLLRILQACTALEELHIQTTLCWPKISPTLISKILSAAPHLRKTLKVLSLRLPCQIEPDALNQISGFEMLERLDISDAFSADYGQDSYDYFGDEGGVEAKPLPYDEPLVECILVSLKHLKRLDLGYGDGESRRYLNDYMLSRGIIMALERASRREHWTFTMENQNVPCDWSSVERGIAARCQALVEIFEDENEDKNIRSMAEEKAKTCPSCKKSATKRCTKCKRQWYCSVDCQKADYKRSHKKICGERFD